MQKNWHAIDAAEVLKRIGSDKKGLSKIEIRERLEKHGRNEIPKKKSLSKLTVFLRQFRNPLVYVLLIIIIISFLLRHYADSIFILVVLLINTTVGFYQEMKANRSLNELHKMVRIKVRVRRGNNEKEIDSSQLVPGDIVIIKEGDRIAADARIITSRNLRTDESTLTGESLPVKKDEKVVSREAKLVEKSNMVFSGTAVTQGQAEAVVVETGERTEFGQTVKLLKETKEPSTPLQRKILKLSKLIGIFILLLVIVIIIAGYFSNQNIEQIFLSALALSVSSIPEGLLPAITVVLVLAMRRVLKSKGVVKKLSAAESLGGVTVICADKTGTLTEGQMRVTQIVGHKKSLLDKTTILNPNDPSAYSAQELKIIKIATVTNDAYIENFHEEERKWTVRGRYTDKALLLSATQAGLKIEKLKRECNIINKWNFDSDRKFAATLCRRGENKKLFVAGAPEEIFKRSSKYSVSDGSIGFREHEEKDGKRILERIAKEGFRVVACAEKNLDNNGKLNSISELATDLNFVGFLALQDPIRHDAKKAIKKITRAGVRPIIITGDHQLTAKTIAQEAGINIQKNHILEGDELEKLSEAELRNSAKKTTLYARTLPKHKLRIVKALQRGGESVAMIGDGVNDAPALKASDVGVALGSGTDVAKEVADVILLDDSYQTIVKAVEQGRVAFDNIRKVFIYLVADDFTEIFIFLGAMFLGLPLPLLAVQILWINLIEDGLPDIALTTENEKTGVMEEKPRGNKEPILSKPIKKWVISVFAINGIITFLFFWFVWKTTGDIEKTRTMILALMAFDSLIFAYSVRSLKKSIFRKNIFSNWYLNAAVLASALLLVLAIYLPLLQGFLKTVPISSASWVLIISLAFVEIFIFEFFKRRFLIRK